MIIYGMLVKQYVVLQYRNVQGTNVVSSQEVTVVGRKKLQLQDPHGKQDQLRSTRVIEDQAFSGRWEQLEPQSHKVANSERPTDRPNQPATATSIASSTQSC